MVNNARPRSIAPKTGSQLLVALLYLACVYMSPAHSQVQAGLPSEFVSLDHPANFENGSLHFGGDIVQIDKIWEDDSGWYGARLVGMPQAVLYFSSQDDTQIDIQLNAGDESFRGSGFTRMERPSRVIANHRVAEYHGTLLTADNETLPTVFMLTESLLGGGESELQIKGEYAYLNGDLGTRAYNQIFNLIHQHPNVRTIVEQNVPGSVNDEINMQTGRLIRRAGLATHIPSGGEASSGGVDLFCAGAYRSLGEGAKVGVHSWSGDEGEGSSFPENSPVHSAQIAYFNEMLGDPLGRAFYFYTLRAASADDMHNMTPEEIAHFQLTTQ